jgi:hypothetical protein
LSKLISDQTKLHKTTQKSEEEIKVLLRDVKKLQEKDFGEEIKSNSSEEEKSK